MGLALAAPPGRPPFPDETDFYVFLYIQIRAREWAWPPSLAAPSSGTKPISMYFCGSKSSRGTGLGRSPGRSLFGATLISMYARVSGGVRGNGSAVWRMRTATMVIFVELSKRLKL